MRLISVAATALLFAQPASAQSIFDLVKQLRPGTSANAARQNGPTVSLATITSKQTAAIDGFLNTPLQDGVTAADRAAAAPLVRQVVATLSCARDSAALNSLNRQHLFPRTFKPPFYNEYIPMQNLSYHDNNTCLDVLRLTDWTKPANNTLKFAAHYISPQSGEAKRQTFELQKASDGQWMIRDIGMGLH
ncbi:hypothetical protein ACFQPG_12295 [Sphingomonas sp. GCM10030256]|uniref:hypothetical protein n=1 Tax=Sphingomonas sp. GCM10030256 TaxID=3273427 RepID=UPI0036239707